MNINDLYYYGTNKDNFIYNIQKPQIYLTIHFLFADVFIFSSVFSLVMLLFAQAP